jgi:hypothetical protein
VNYWDEQMAQVMNEAVSTPFDLVLGRRTYDIFAAHWPHATEEDGAKPFNAAIKYVASRSHPRLEWSNSVLIEGDAAEGVAALKKEDRFELQVHGSGEGTIPSGLKFVDSKVATTGSRNRYLRAGRGDRHRIVRTGLTLGPGGTPVSGPQRRVVGSVYRFLGSERAYVAPSVTHFASC